MEIIRLHAFRDNYIWLLRQNGRVAVVDPGDAGPVIDYLAQSGDTLHSILITHHHADHCGGISRLAQEVPVYGPATEAIEGVTVPLHPGQRILLELLPKSPVSLEILDVSGHTRGHIAYFLASGNPGCPENRVFSGDALFNLGCGRIFEGTPVQMQEALARLARLPGNTQVHAAHEYVVYNLPFALAVEPGNPALQQRAQALRQQLDRQAPTVPFSLAMELATNPFLRCGQPEVMASASHHAQKQLTDPLEVFTTLRTWRNNF